MPGTSTSRLSRLLLTLLLPRNSLAFVNTTATGIAYGQKPGRSLKILVYPIAAVFTNVREFRVVLLPRVCSTVSPARRLARWVRGGKETTILERVPSTVRLGKLPPLPPSSSEEVTCLRTLIYSHRSGPNGVVADQGGAGWGGLRCFAGEYPYLVWNNPRLCGVSPPRLGIISVGCCLVYEKWPC